MKSEKTRSKIISAVSIFVTAFCVIGTVIASIYTVNQSDDYQHAMEIGGFHEGFFTYFATSFSYMIRMYKGWAGNYFSMFLQSLLSPPNNGGAMQLRLVMIANALLFIAVFFVLVMRYIKRVYDIDTPAGLAILALIVFPLMNYRCYYEIFYWFSGAVSYSFPLSFLYLAFILGIGCCSKNKEKRVSYIAALICAFLGAGGSLTLAGAGCYVLLIALVYDRYVSGRWNIRIAGLFATTFLGTLINVLAPGNYVRADGDGTGVSFAGAVVNTFRAAYTEYRWLFHDTTFLVVIMIAIMIGAILAGRLKPERRAYYVAAFAALLTPFAAIFPVVMGYGSDFLANRTLFVIDATVYISMINAALAVGAWLSDILGEGGIRQLAVVFASCAAVFLCMSNYSVKDMASVRTLLSDLNGTFSDYYDECAKMEEYFALCKDKDVVMTPDRVPAGPADFSCFYLENSWVNDSIAQYYGMRSLYLEE